MTQNQKLCSCKLQSVRGCSWIWLIPPPQSKWGEEASIYISSCCQPLPQSLMSLLLLINHSSWIKLDLMKRFRNVNSPCSESTSRSTETRRCTHHRAVVIATAVVHGWVMLSNQPYLRLLGKDINLCENDTHTLCQALYRPVANIWFFLNSLT